MPVLYITLLLAPIGVRHQIDPADLKRPSARLRSLSCAAPALGTGAFSSDWTVHVGYCVRTLARNATVSLAWERFFDARDGQHRAELESRYDAYRSAGS